MASATPACARVGFRHTMEVCKKNIYYQSIVFIGSPNSLVGIRRGVMFRELDVRAHMAIVRLSFGRVGTYKKTGAEKRYM